jgi:PIN domain nuclease of toxin-antitoxin system
VDLLLDTHILIWMATDPDRIPPKLLAAIADAEIRYVSIVTALEIQLKNLRHPDTFTFSNGDLETAMQKFACTQMPLTFQDVATLQQMDFIHNDPFDRLLMRQAANRSIHLATVDQLIVETFNRWKAFYLFSTERQEG